MSELEEQVAAIVTNAVEEILRLIDRDDVEVPSSEDIASEVSPISSPTRTPNSGPRPRVEPTTDPLLRNFLGVDT